MAQGWGCVPLNLVLWGMRDSSTPPHSPLTTYGIVSFSNADMLSLNYFYWNKSYIPFSTWHINVFIQVKNKSVGRSYNNPVKQGCTVFVRTLLYRSFVCQIWTFTTFVHSKHQLWWSLATIVGSSWLKLGTNLKFQESIWIRFSRVTINYHDLVRFDLIQFDIGMS